MSRRALIVPLAGLALLAADAAAAAGRGKPSEVRPLVSLPDANGERQLVAPLAPCDPAQLTAAQLAALARRLWRPEPGVALVVPAPPGASDEERWTDFRGAQDRLQATASSTLQGRQDRYGPARACDGDPRTAWVEGAADDGEGEWLQLELDSLFADRAAYDRARAELDACDDCPGDAFVSAPRLAGLVIVPGYPRDEKTFRRNNRPQRLTAELEYTSSRGARVRQTFTLPLTDAPAPHLFPLTADGDGLLFGTLRLRLTLDAVTRGLKDRDTCLAEVALVFASGA